jgi:hypothetical protein
MGTHPCRAVMCMQVERQGKAVVSSGLSTPSFALSFPVVEWFWPTCSLNLRKLSLLNSANDADDAQPQRI